MTRHPREHSNDSPDELFRLTTALLAEEITADEHAQLETLLAGDRTARARYVQFIQDSTGLQLWSERHHARLTEAASQAPPASKPAPVVASSGWRPGQWTLLGGTVVLTWAFWAALTIFFASRNPAKPVDAPGMARVETVAQLSAVHDARWSGDQPAWAVPTRLAQGAVLELEAGLAEVLFDSGARVIVNGPARFRIDRATSGSLSHGRIAAHIPQQAAGFAIDTGLAKVTDLGTEFGLEVSGAANRQRASVVVFEGAVQVALDAGASKAQQPARLLRAGESVSIRSVEVGRSAGAPQFYEGPALDRERFVRRMPQSTAPAYLHWSFDERGGSETISSSDGGAVRFRARLAPTGKGPKWIAGKFGVALQFDGRNDRMECSYAGISGSEPRTVAFWARLPVDSDPHPHAIVYWGLPGNQVKWLVGVNPAARAQRGALCVEWGGGWLAGERDLRDGRWHHLAVTFDGAPADGDVDLAQAIRLYVDGQLEPAAGEVDVPVQTSAQGQLVVGHLPQSRQFFRGAVDELFIFPRALQPAQIVELMHHNQLVNSPADEPVRSSRPAGSSRGQE